MSRKACSQVSRWLEQLADLVAGHDKRLLEHVEKRINRKLEKLMTAADNLQASADRIEGVITDSVVPELDSLKADVTALQGQIADGTATEDAAKAVADRLDGLSSRLTDAVASPDPLGNDGSTPEPEPTPEPAPNPEPVPEPDPNA